MKTISSVLALMLLPYGAVQASPARQADTDTVIAPSAPSSCAVLSRLGIEAPAEDASLVEDKILSGADAVEICQQLPNANPGSECLDARALALLEEIPLGTRTQLIKELASGANVETIAPEILGQISMPLVELLAREHSDPQLPLPVPVSEDSSRGQASPAANGSSAGNALSPTQKMISVKGSGDLISYRQVQVSRVLAFRIVQSIYYHVTMMPTGPPADSNDRRSFFS